MPEAAEAQVVETPAAPAPAEAAQVAGTPAPSESATPEGETTPETAATPEKSPEKQAQSRYDRKINKLYREAAEQRARADFNEQRLNELTPKPKADEAAPRLENFSDIEEYATAKAEYEKTKGIKEYESKQREQTNQVRQRELQSSWEAKAEKAASKYDDFDEVVGDLKPITPWAIAIMRAANGDDIAHHLGTNIAEAKRIAALDPADQFIAIGRLSAKLEASPPDLKRVTQAPAPITPVSGTRTATVRGSENASDYKTFLRERNRELGRKTT